MALQVSQDISLIVTAAEPMAERKPPPILPTDEQSTQLAFDMETDYDGFDSK